MDNKSPQELFHEIATPELILEWIDKNGFPKPSSMKPLINAPIVSDIPIISNSNKSEKKIRFLASSDQSKSLGLIKLNRHFTTAQNENLRPNNSIEERRSSLQIMRQYQSLPLTSTGNNLRQLIDSKITLPRYNQDYDELKYLRQTNWIQFYINILSSILSNLNIKSLIDTINCCATLLTNSLFIGCYQKSNFMTNPPLPFLNFDDLYVQYSNDNWLKLKVHLQRLVQNKKLLSDYERNKIIVLKKQEKELERYFPDCLDNLTTFVILDLSYNSDSYQKHFVVLGNPEDMNMFEDKSSQQYEYLVQFIQLCVRALNNASLFEVYSQEFNRNKNLLECIHELYEEQSSLENFIQCGLLKMKLLIDFEQIAMFLLSEETEGPKQISEIYSLNGKYQFSNGLNNSVGSKNIALMVSMNGEKFTYKSEDDMKELNDIGVRNLLCKPIHNSDNQILGAVQFINKKQGNFNQNDEDILEAMIIFCTIGIANCRLYEDMTKSNARAKVALEVLSYHNSATNNDVEYLMSQSISQNPNSLNLGRHQFDDFSLSAEQMVLATEHIFSKLKLISTFNINRQTLYRWTLTVMKNYRNIAYHNWNHAFNVFHTMYFYFHTARLKRHFSDIEVLGIMIGCLCHDIDHRGTNNNFQIKTDSALARLYGSQATLEQHHFNLTVLILTNSDGNNILQNLSTAQLTSTIKVIKQAILATDLSMYFKIKDEFIEACATETDNWNNQGRHDLLLNNLMTSCDIAAATKQWSVAQEAAYRVMEEFFRQGDVEKSVYNMEPQDMMDRRKEKELPKMQVQWIDFVCEPLYKTIKLLDSELEQMYQQLIDNRQHWKELQEYTQ